MPPRRGWTFHAGDNIGLKSDPELKVEPFEKDPWCSTITVTATGKAGVKKSSVLGHYKRIEHWSCGKPVKHSYMNKTHEGDSRCTSRLAVKRFSCTMPTNMDGRSGRLKMV